jgi:hypothetical protein
VGNKLMLERPLAEVKYISSGRSPYGQPHLSLTRNVKLDLHYSTKRVPHWGEKATGGTARLADICSPNPAGPSRAFACGVQTPKPDEVVTHLFPFAHDTIGLPSKSIVGLLQC